jgi:hypothetical protein
LQFLMSGCNFCFNQGITTAGVFGATFQATLSNSAPAGRGSSYAVQTTGSGGQVSAFSLASNYSTLIAGFAYYPTGLSFVIQPQILTFYTNSIASQCDVRVNSSGLFYFTRNGTTISGLSSIALSQNVWQYIEFKAFFSIGTSGTCEVRVNGVPVLTATGLDNSSTGNGGLVQYGTLGATQGYYRDFYFLDGITGVNTDYLGDISVQEYYPNGAGVNSQWTPNVGPFLITSVAAGTGVYTGVITGGGSNAYQGYYFVASGFGQSANNGTFLCTASSLTTLTLANASSQIDTTGTIDFQCIVQPGIHGGAVDNSTSNVGTRPNQDVTYISDSTSSDISDFVHQQFTTANALIPGITHLSYARKDDVGTRLIAQVLLLGGATAVSNSISLSTNYQYYQQVMDVDPNSNPWTVSNFNLTTGGVKELT